ncbi:hypothetical protein Pan44_26650 [Caulifigura coniformis]|uniref:Uncharacterized protein n=1 Tax=Caulifigura coniformis TaxID=2527983 RepID=A0A517SEW0_9PLAN|nr:hypothetical protein [Caulifigura coniformis]QDT54630.1 hypothetical protein Pan44_26650 [Caulifigura coniformis]
MPVSELRGREASASENSYLRRQYYARNYASEVAAIDAVYDFLVSQLGDPPILTGNELRNITPKEGDVLDSYFCEAIWGPFQRRTPPAVGESQFNFEIGGQQTKVIVPISQTVYKPASDLLPLPQIALIGDQGMGEPPTGADIFEPVHSASLTKWMALSDLTPEFEDAIADCVGKWNNATWRRRPAGEVLFMGCTGAQRGANDLELTFRWMTRRNLESSVIAGITVAAKRGWDFLWPRYRINYAEDGSWTVANEITHIVVSQVMESADLSILGIDA